MTTRRGIVLALIVPALVSTGVALAWSAWSQQRHHERIADLASRAGQEEALTGATGSVTGEVGYIIAMRRVSPDDIPAVLTPYVASGRALSSAAGGPAVAMSLLDQADRAGPEALMRLKESGISPSPAVERVMQPIEGGARSVVVGRVGPDGVFHDRRGQLQGLQRCPRPPRG